MTSYQEAAKRLAEAKKVLYNAKVDISFLEKATDDDGIFETSSHRVYLCKDYPCKVIQKGISAKGLKEYLPDDLDGKLIIDKGFNIPAGCTVVATFEDGKVINYKNSTSGYQGYLSHDEVGLRFEEKA